jgi:hypothetical protein
MGANELCILLGIKCILWEISEKSPTRIDSKVNFYYWTGAMKHQI